MAISFNSIPINLRTPLFYAEDDNSQANIASFNGKALILAGKTSSGTASANIPVQVFSSSEAGDKFGFGSQAHLMARAFLNNNPSTPLIVIPLDDDGSGVPATGDITVDSAPTATGTLSLYIAGQRLQVAVNASDAEADVASAINTAINGASNLPVTSEVSDVTVTLTAKNDGTPGNGIDVRVNYRGTLGGEALPTGLQLTLPSGGLLASGATNPDYSTAITNMGDNEYDYIMFAHADTATLDAVATELDNTTGRWSFDRQVYGHAWTALRDTVNNLVTLGDGRNDPELTIIGVEPTPTWQLEVLGAYVGKAANALEIDPARPLQTLNLVGVLPPASEDRFTRSERQSLLNDGIATVVSGDTGVQIERSITTFQENAFGENDISYLDVQTRFTLMRIIRTYRQVLTSKFGRHKLADNGSRFGAGQAIVTPNIMRAEAVSIYEGLERDGLVENAEGFENALIVERNAGDPNRLDILLPPDLVNQLRILAVKVQFRLQF